MCIKRGGGGIKFLLRGASKYTPNPPPLKNVFWPELGGGGGYIIPPWQKTHNTYTQTQPKKLTICKQIFLLREFSVAGVNLGVNHRGRKFEASSPLVTWTAEPSEKVTSKFTIKMNPSCSAGPHSNKALEIKLRKAQSTRTAKFDPRTLLRKNDHENAHGSAHEDFHT